MKRIMIVAGGEWQIPIIRKAKEMGLFVVNSNLYLDSPGFSISDVGVVADVLDKEKNLEYAKQYNVNAIVTDQSDVAVTTVAYVADSLRLPGIGKNIADIFTNKYLMREFCLAHDFPTPQFKLCRDLSEANFFTEECGFPVVVKPPANQSSRGVVKVNTKRELANAFALSLQHSNDGTVLLEAFVGGTELTVDGIQLNAGGHYCLATSSKTHYAHNEMVANQLRFSQFHQDIDYKALHKQHNHMVELMSLPFGLTHAEYKYHQGKFYLIEVAARGGGTKISSDIVPLMSGIDSNQLLIRMTLGEKIDSIHPTFNKRISVLDFFEFRPGKIKMIIGLEQAKAMSGIVSIGLNLREGDVVHPASDDRSRHGYVIAFAENASSLNYLLDKVHQMVQIRYE